MLLSLPDPNIFARILRENDVTGLAILTEVNTHCLRDELGIKSLGHRAAINHLIRQLQEMSTTYQEQSQRSARLSSVGLGSQVGSPCFATPSFAPRAVCRTLGSMVSPLGSSTHLQDHFGLGRPPAQSRNVLQEGPELQRLDRPKTITIYSLEDAQNRGSLKDNRIEAGLERDKSEPIVNNTDVLNSGSVEPSLSNMGNTSNTQQAERCGREGELIVVDENGRKRRRLVLAQPDQSGITQTIAAKSPIFDEAASSPETLQRDTNASFKSTILSSTSDSPIAHDELILDTQGPPVPEKAATSISESALDLAEVTPEPGIIMIDNNGRKRMRPIHVHGIKHNLKDPKTGERIPKEVDDTFGSPSPDLREVKHTNQAQQRLYGNKATRKADQVYLGFESMSIDTVIYGEIDLGKNLDKELAAEQSHEPDNFNIVLNGDAGNGQRLYVNARMKYLLRSQRVSLKKNGRGHVGIIPYPDRIGRKNCPLSVTVFSPSPNGVTASRANRSAWTKEGLVRDTTEADGMVGNIFNLGDPALARKESEDPEWKALEKWNFMDGKDEVLPVYGDSDSEGEYDLDTWREMENERGHIARPLGRPGSAKLTDAEVYAAINASVNLIISDWTLKRLPKLKLKGWRLWAKSRRDRDSLNLINSFNDELGRLEARISRLWKEIALEEWSKTAQIIKQCKNMQPSIFDREAIKWKITTLKLQQAPKRPPPAARRTKPAKTQEHIEPLEDGEGIRTTDTESSDSSEANLEDFIVEDEAHLDKYQPVVVDDDDDLTMGDIEEGVASCTLIGGEAKPKTPSEQPKEFSQPVPSPLNVIDLTQQSDPVEPEALTPKPEPHAFETPPLYDSGDDSEIFQRSRSKKPVFRTPSVVKSPTKTAEIICLESDSDSSVGASLDTPSHFPALNDVDGIRGMDPASLVERQDRKRLLIWMVAHTPASRRQDALSYLNGLSMEASRANVLAGLTALRHHRTRLKNMDKEESDRIMQIAAWRVCWTIPVKVTSKGLQVSHIISTLGDEDGYETFYDFLLGCLQYYQNTSDLASQNTAKKKRVLLHREESDENLKESPFRKRKYLVTESQGTLQKRQAARERMRGDEERRRRKQLRSKISDRNSLSSDSLEVIVNPGKLDDEIFIRLNPAFGNGLHMKPHQKEGLQFMWREITGDHQHLQGCLLAHVQGLGKTMQVISLLVTIAEASISEDEGIRQQIPLQLRENRTLILCPVTLVENWWDELLIWPPTTSNPLGKLRKVSSAIELSLRLAEIQAWNDEGGVLILGYPTFTELIQNKPRANRPPALAESQHQSIKNALLGGPSLVVADEAHNFKNRATAISRAINQIKTTSRIALTGTPLANSLGEYYSMIDWIAPGYLGKPAEFLATYEEPIYQGLYRESTESQYRESRKRLKALELELEPKVHRRGNAVLHAELKGKVEFVITVPLTKLQEDLYRIYAVSMLGASKGDEPRPTTLLSWLSLLQLLCNHPKSFRDDLITLKAEGSPTSKPRVPRKKARQSDAEEGPLGSEEDAVQLSEPVTKMGLSQVIDKSEEMFEMLTTPVDVVSLSNKMQLLMSILKFAESAQDQVLVFSHRIPTLDFIGEQLAKTHKTYARIDGKMLPEKRQPITKDFNDGKTSICLISTRAGGTGLNLFGANRVVIIDDHFNPMWEQQAIGRAYRIGQRKPVYVYRLTVGGTFEQAIQNQALFKEQLATRVVDQKNPNRHAVKGAGQYLFPPKTVEKEDLSKFLKKDALLDHLLADQTT